MKPAGYWPCRNEIINAHLSTPHKYEPFTELFDTEKLDEIRDHYGADLYKECYGDTFSVAPRKNAKLRDYKRYYSAADIGQTIYTTRKEAAAAPRPATIYQPR